MSSERHDRGAIAEDRRPGLALVRGPWLNTPEVRGFEPLQKAFRIWAIGSYPAHATTEIEVVRRFCPGSALDRVPKVRRVYRGALDRGLGSPYFLRGLRSALAGAAIVDVYESFFGHSGQTLQFIGDRPLVVSVGENTPFFRAQSRRGREIDKRVRERATLFIARTEQIRDCLVLEGIDPARIETVYNGVDTEEFAPGASAGARETFALAEQELVMLYVGKLVWEKGVDDALRVFAAVSKARRDVPMTFLVAGSGSYAGALRSLARALGIERSVRFLGNVSYQRMADLYRVADIVLAPSKPYPGGQEQESRVLREALASGRALVTTACGGSAEIVGDAGAVVPPADHIQMARAVLALIDDPEARAHSGGRARARALSTFSLERAGELRLRAYRRALDGA